MHHRKLTEHLLDPKRDTISITVTDAPGPGGDHHRYELAGFDACSNPSSAVRAPDSELVILFQNGPIPQVGANGITHEALLAIVADRLRCLQSGPFACKPNERALTHVEEAIHWLQQRTIERTRRGVEGTFNA